MIIKNIMVYVEKIIFFLVGCAVILMMLHVCADVVGKNIFGRPMTGTITIVSNYYMPIVTFVPLILVQHYNQHISVDVIFNRFPTALQFHINAWIYVFSAFIFGLLAYYGWIEASVKYRSGTFLIEAGKRVPTWPGYFFPPIGYGMISIYLLVQFLEYLVNGAKSLVQRS
jgi:TRAP-type C4-dicarboxylate transport system permease small subunit